MPTCMRPVLLDDCSATEPAASCQGGEPRETPANSCPQTDRIFNLRTGIITCGGRRPTPA